MQKIKNYSKRTISTLLVLVLAFNFLMLMRPATVSAAQITGRKTTMSNSAGAASSVNYTFDSSALPTTTAVRSVALQACTTASGACSTPSGFSSASSTLLAQPTGLGSASGWSVSTAVAGSLRITHASNATVSSGVVNIQWGAVANPTAQNTSFFLRATTYSDAAWTTALDTGTMALSTAQAISVTASVDESLTFCSGTSGVTSSSCSGATGTTVALGTLTSSATASGVSQLGVGTNGVSGYAITVNGTTLTCTACAGTPTISALAAQTASTTGTEQFGINLRDNATPNVGIDPDGSGTATPTANYNTVDQFRFVTTDSIASKGSSDQFRRFHVSYIANIDTATEAGSYTTTVTYIATATF